MTDQNNHIGEFQLQAYLDGILDPAGAVNVQTHLAACPTCSRVFSQLENLESRLKNLPEVDLSKDLSSLVVSQLKEEKSLSPAITWTLVIEALAAGIVIGALVPAFQAAGWLPRLEEIKISLGSATNIFLAQLASSWIVWWAELKLQLNLWMTSIHPLQLLPLKTLSPWILIGTAGVLVILVNGLLLARQPQSNGNHKQIQV